MSLYNLKSAGEGYRITKFDDDLNVESTYLVSWADCECPQGQRGKSCRHQKMLHLMRDRVDSPWFFDYDQGVWVAGEGAGEAEPLPKGVIALDLNDPVGVHNAIADAVGEPEAKLSRPLPTDRPKVRRRI